MRRSTGLALVAVGAILLLAINLRVTFVSLRLTGLILGEAMASYTIPPVKNVKCAVYLRFV